jgi:hypothetical protein
VLVDLDVVQAVSLKGTTTGSQDDPRLGGCAFDVPAKG